jgi:uncharacterized membrane protein
MTEPSDERQSSTANRESRLRSILKALTWRVIASATTFTVAYFVVLLGAPAEQRELATKAAAVVAAFDFVLKLLLYYFHERAWQLLPRGSIRRIVQPFSRD